MVVNFAAEQAFGTLGTICWTGQILPQIWKSWREKSTEGLSQWLMLIWGISAVFLGVFVIVQDLNIPLIVQPQIFGLLSIASWSQCLFYARRIPLCKVLVILLLTLALMGGFEVGMVFAVRPAADSGNRFPVTFFGVMTSILLALGLFPQYWEIIRFREVKGISLPFITMDTLGGVFSLLSLVFREKFDVMAGVAYSLVVVLDSVVIILALMLNSRAEQRRRRLAGEKADYEAQLASIVGGTADEQCSREATVGDWGFVSHRQSTSQRSSTTQTDEPPENRAAVVYVNDVTEKSG